MYQVINKEQLNQQTFLLEIKAPKIAENFKTGQFVIIRLDEYSERIPLTVASVDLQKGTVSVIFQAIGVSTIKLSKVQENNLITDVLGPLGTPSHLPEYKNVLMIAGGVGSAIAIPTLYALKNQQNTITSIIGFRNKKMVILEKEIQEYSDFFYLVTDDGSAGEKGFVTTVFTNLLQKETFDFIYCIGPIPMMAAVSEIAKEHQIPIQVSLNPIMIDGTGMCGGCRVKIGNEIKFACIDGPEFDGALVDYQELSIRNNTYQHHHKCNMEKQYEK